MKVLVVDDSRAMRAILSKALKGAGVSEIVEARDGKEGLTYLEQHPETPLALVDWNMPEMTGIEMVREVRKQSSLGSVRLMMVTTETEQTHMQQAFEAGADEYVMKPFTQDVIVDKLRLMGF